MTDDEIIEKTRALVEAQFKVDASGHDYWHMHRVWKLARRIARRERGVNMLTLELAAWLHDIADFKFHDDEEARIKLARTWLEGFGTPGGVIADVEDIIRNVSFKGAGVANKLTTIEGQIVHDADKLDAMGAIGISRTFAFGGARGRMMHDPAKPPQRHDTFEAYKNNTSPTINHFYEKLLLLKDRMFTKTGRELAEHRHDVMEEFLREFMLEWEGER